MNEILIALTRQLFQLNRVQAFFKLITIIYFYLHLINKKTAINTKRICLHAKISLAN